MGRARHRRTYPRHGRRPVEPLADTRSRLTIAVDFDGHGVGKLLLPLVVRRQARKEMPANLATLRARLETGAAAAAEQA